MCEFPVEKGEKYHVSLCNLTWRYVLNAAVMELFNPFNSQR